MIPATQQVAVAATDEVKHLIFAAAFKQGATGCIQFSKGNATASLAFQGWAMSQHEESGVFGGVKRVLHGCDAAVRGLELLELAATGARINSFAVGSHNDLEQGSYKDLEQVDEGEDDIPVPTPLIPVPAPIVSLPLIAV